MHAILCTCAQTAPSWRLLLLLLLLMFPLWRRKLSWEAATERLLDVGSIGEDEWPSAAEKRYTAALWRFYRSVVGELGCVSLGVCVVYF
jgi:hypothetical protein